MTDLTKLFMHQRRMQVTFLFRRLDKKVADWATLETEEYVFVDTLINTHWLADMVAGFDHLQTKITSRSSPTL